MSNLRSFVPKPWRPLLGRIWRGLISPLLALRTRLRISRLVSRTDMAIHLEIGSGEKAGHNGWTTLDQGLRCDLHWDLRRGIPFPDNSLTTIYSEHVLEHLPFADIVRLLGECHRALKPGGMLSISVPDARRFIQAYMDAGQPTHLVDGPLCHPPAYNRTTAIDFVNYIAYMDGHHRYLFDTENLLHLLRASGLTEVRAREFDAATDRPERRPESIYAIGLKPVTSQETEAPGPTSL